VRALEALGIHMLSLHFASTALSPPRVLHSGDRHLPPLVDVPGVGLPLPRVIKPPDAEALWEWARELGREEDLDPSWASVWPAAAALAAHVAAKPDSVRGARVVELGAGLGVAGLSAAAAGAGRVTLVDREPLALHCAMATAEVCGLATAAVGEEAPPGAVSASCCDWAEAAQLLGGADLVLGAEVLYDPSAVEPLLGAAAALLSGSRGTLLLAEPAAGRAVGCRGRLEEVPPSRERRVALSVA